jgi:tripartite ATP-independent transporter DctM subunit
MELFFLFLLVVLMAIALGSGFPVAFALPGSAIITIGIAGLTGLLFEANPSAYFHSSGPYEWLSAGVTNLRGVYWEPERDTLIAIPLFIFMGLMLQRSKVAEDLLLAMAQLFGPVPGGLGISVVFVGALLAATTGIVGATVVAMGLISLPSMLRNNYSPSLATGTIAASGTLGQIIPPSIVLIILADQLASASDQASSLRKSLHKEVTGEMSMPSFLDVTSTSAGEMFLGALVPGLVLVAVYMLYILTVALIFPKVAPAVGFEGRMDTKFWVRIAVTLIPPLALIFLVLGSILSGIATVNQAGAIGAAGAVFMGSFRLSTGKRSAVYPSLLAVLSLILIFYCLENYEMNFRAADTPEDYTGLWLGAIGSATLMGAFGWSLVILLRVENVLQSVMLETAKTTSLVFIILLGAAVLTSAFRAFGGEVLVRDYLNSLPGGFWTKFIIVMAVIFILGFFLDFIEIAVVVVPIVAPILLADPSANITAVWLGVMIGLNIQTSFLTPPFGFALFYLRGVAPAVVKTIQMYKGVIPFIMLQVLALVIVGSFPPLVNYLPQRTTLLSDSAPPPKNPKLQYCLEKHTWDQLSAPDSRVSASIATAEALNLSVLTEKYQAQASNAFGSARQAIQELESALQQELLVAKAAQTYKPQLVQVRQIEREIKSRSSRLKEIDTQLKRLNQGRSTSQIAELKLEKLGLDTEITALVARLPKDWQATYETFSELVQTEAKSRTMYRRQADSSYSEIYDIVLTIESYEDLLKVEGNLLGLDTVIKSKDPQNAAAEIKAVMAEFNSIAGASKIKSHLSKTRKALRKKNVDAGKVAKLYQKAIDEYRGQLLWLSQSQGAVLSGLKTYLDDISGTIGARQLGAMPRETALFIAKCSAAHRDISLNF